MILNSNFAVKVTAENLTATTMSVRSGSTFVGESGIEETGELKTFTANDNYLGIDDVTRIGDTYTVAEGIYENGVNVIGMPLYFFTEANATSLDILPGKSGYVNGKLVHGNLYPERQIKPELEFDENYNVKLIIPKDGLYAKTTDIIVSMDDIIALEDMDVNSIKYGESIYGIQGLFTEDGDDIDPYEIIKGKTVYSKGKKITGMLETQSALNIGSQIGVESAIISWTNPAVGPYGGVIISNVTDGKDIIIYQGPGSNRTAGGRSSIEINGMESGKEYLIKVTSFCDPLPDGESKVVSVIPL
ncbi:MAG: hypothetical protein IKA36_01570 [Clostridia bacterium]|nr:hypothetical protein [Clostridia bacterium]